MALEIDTEQNGDLTLYLGAVQTTLPADEVIDWCKDAVLTSDESGPVWERLDEDALAECVLTHGE